MIQTLLGDRRFVEVHALHHFDLGDIAGSVLESIHGLRSSALIPHLRILKGFMVDPHSCLKHARSRCNLHVATATQHAFTARSMAQNLRTTTKKAVLVCSQTKGPPDSRRRRASTVSGVVWAKAPSRTSANDQLHSGEETIRLQYSCQALLKQWQIEKKMKIENFSKKSVLFRLFHFHDCCSDGSDTL